MSQTSALPRSTASVSALSSAALLLTFAGLWLSPSFWVAGILPLLAAAFLLPRFSPAELKPRFILIAFFAALCLALHPLLNPAPSAAALSPFMLPGTLLADAWFFYLLWKFKKSTAGSQSESALARKRGLESYELSRQIVQSSGQGVWLLDSNLNDSFINSRLLEMLELSSQPASILETLNEPARSLLRGALTRRDAVDVPLEIQVGKRRSLLSMSRLSGKDGEFSGALGLFTDVTRRRELEERLAQSARLDSVARVAASLSSELGAGMRELSRAAHDLEKNLGPWHSGSEDLAAIRNASVRAEGLMTQLAAFSRKESGEFKAVDVAKRAESMLPTLEKLCPSGVRVSLESWPTPCLVFAEPSQIEQIILNLVVNARDAMPRGGEIKINLAPVALDSASKNQALTLRPGSYLRLRISDNGSGIAPERLPKIFEPFYSTKEIGKGTGLGLATIYGIVRQCGGAISVTSEPGRGSSFEVYLPFAGENS